MGKNFEDTDADKFLKEDQIMLKQNTPQMSIDMPQIKFYQGSREITENPLESFKKKVRELCNIKNLHFLFGAGTSSGAIPTMVEIKKDLDKDIEDNHKEFYAVYTSVKKDNLEEVLHVLYANRYYLEGTNDVGEKNDNKELRCVENLIKHIQKFMFNKINIPKNAPNATDVLQLYLKFFSKLTFRNKDLSRINIFTTNNDLFNEKALDHLNINYNNGFGGGLERRFNPARFRYTFSRRIDLNLEKFEPLENMVYLYKLHGSVNWVESEGNSLFNIEELALKGGEETPEDKPVLIFPTPLKQNQSLGSPYADLIREFQAKLTLPNAVLFIIGYSFSDEHLNNIIYQALASNPSILLVIFGDHRKCALNQINDNRVFRFSGTQGVNKLHYFNYIVNEILPDIDENKDKNLLENFIAQLKEINELSQRNDWP